MGEDLERLHVMIGERQQHVDDQLQRLWEELHGLARRQTSSRRRSTRNDLADTPDTTDGGNAKDSAANYLRVCIISCDHFHY